MDGQRVDRPDFVVVSTLQFLRLDIPSVEFLFTLMLQVLIIVIVVCRILYIKFKLLLGDFP